MSTDTPVNHAMRKNGGKKGPGMSRDLQVIQRNLTGKSSGTRVITNVDAGDTSRHSAQQAI